MTSPYTYQFLDDAPIVVFTPNADYRIGTDHAASTKALLDILDQSARPLVYIADLQGLRYDIDEIMAGASTVSRGKNPTYHHPNMKKLIVVTTDDGLIQSYQGLDNPIFGNVHAYIYSTLDDALADAYASI
ncbi:MAG: hypothetical protein IAE80_04270 [Anaerolinea sp.]|nr:hypothetical protein [Anaerolinea sp.]